MAQYVTNAINVYTKYFDALFVLRFDIFEHFAKPFTTAYKDIYMIRVHLLMH